MLTPNILQVMTLTSNIFEVMPVNSSKIRVKAKLQFSVPMNKILCGYKKGPIWHLQIQTHGMHDAKLSRFKYQPCSNTATSTHRLQSLKRKSSEMQIPEISKPQKNKFICTNSRIATLPNELARVISPD